MWRMVTGGLTNVNDVKRRGGINRSGDDIEY